MKNIIIIGAGTGGTMIANKLYKALDKKEWQITIIDPSEIHYYQPGFLFIPFGIYSKKDVEKPTKKFLPKKINFICSEVDSINPLDNTVILKNQNVLSYDYLFVSSGTRLSPEDTPGLKDKLWQVDIFEFYTAEGAIALGQKLKNFKGGKLVMSIVDLPFKCPIAPIEFVCLADEYLKKKGIREKTEIIYVTPLSGAFTKPIASKMLNNLLLSKNIKIVPDFYIEKIDNDNKKLISYDGRDVPFDLLVIVPLNKGADFIEKSGLGDELNFVPVNMHTLQVEKHPNIFVLGDAAAIPTSKAGSVVHFAGEIVFKNFMSIIKNKNIIHSFDGHANCFIEAGHGKATIIDFNYNTEPLPGKYPVPLFGPFSLLSVNRLNHIGKLLFKWLYWKFIIKGRYIPISSNMSTKGKKQMFN